MLGILKNKKGYICIESIIVLGLIIAMGVLMVMTFTAKVTEIENPNSQVQIKEEVKEEAIIDNDLDNKHNIVDNNTETKDKSLWSEIQTEVIAGLIVSVICFVAGQTYAKFRSKKEKQIDDRLKTLNLNKYDI